MPSLLTYLVAIAALDSFNPTTTAIQIYLLSTPKPIARSTAFIAGVCVTYWAAGLAVVLGAKQLTISFPTLPNSLTYLLQLVIGVVLLVVGWKLAPSSGSQKLNQPVRLTIVQAFLFGGAATLWDLPTALPYLAAIERIVQSRLDIFTTASVLALYNVIFVLPLMILLGIRLFLAEKSNTLIHAINRSMQQWGRRILQILLMGLGVILIVNCVAFFLNHPMF